MLETSQPDPRARHLREKLEAFAKSLGAAGNKAGPVIGASVHQNYQRAVEQMVASLREAKKNPLPPEEFKSAARGIVSLVIWDTVERLAEVVAACESPAEMLLAFAIETACRARQIPVVYDVPTGPPQATFSASDLLDDVGVDIGIRIRPQAGIGDGWESKYRADFLIECWQLTGDPSSPIQVNTMAVEVDGRAGHATDDKRAYDNERDRYFRNKGYLTDRYTGKQVYDDPFGCATKIIDQLTARQ